MLIQGSNLTKALRHDLHGNVNVGLEWLWFVPTSATAIFTSESDSGDLFSKCHFSDIFVSQAPSPIKLQDQLRLLYGVSLPSNVAHPV